MSITKKTKKRQCFTPHQNKVQTLFTIAKTWKQPKCLLTNEWIRKMWYICVVEYYSVIKKNKMMPFATMWM